MNWGNRGDRLARMRERDEFSKYFMPVAYLVGGLGLGLLAYAFVNPSESRGIDRQTLGVGLCLLGFPVVLFVYRFARGHFSSRLRD